MLITLLAPEYLLAKAYTEWHSSKLHLRQYLPVACQDRVEWTLSHTFLANMGGFVIRFDKPLEELSREPLRPSSGRNEAGPIMTVPPLSHQGDDTNGPDLRLSASHDAYESSCKVQAEGEVPLNMRAVDKAVKNSALTEHGAHLHAESMRKFIAREQRNEWGASIWTADDTNLHNVQSASKPQQLDIFSRSWEKERYLKRAAWDYFQQLVPLQGGLWVLDACQLLLARKMGIIARLPDVSTDQIQDRNKKDAVLKILAVCQVTWLLIQVAVRAARNLDPSQLEIVVLAFSACTVCTYVLYWSKPQDVRTTLSIAACRRPSATEISRIAIHGPAHMGSSGSRMPNDATHCGALRPLLLAVAVAAILFGGIHFFAWNSVFPTPGERTLWRAAIVMTVAIPVAILLCSTVTQSITHTGLRHYIRVSILLLLGPGYVVARVYITVESLRTLLYLSAESYQSTWTTDLPHMG